LGLRLEMNREDLDKCKQHIDEALLIMERVADTQPEVHVLIALREIREDIAWLESYGEQAGNVVRLSDVIHLRAIAGAGSCER
jgi:hypothetical protein